MQEIDGKAVYNIVPRERPPEPPAATVIRDVSGSPNAGTLNETPTAPTVYEMDGRRPLSFSGSRRTSHMDDEATRSRGEIRENGVLGLRDPNDLLE
jgi:hypothetical protein